MTFESLIDGHIPDSVGPVRIGCNIMSGAGDGSVEPANRPLCSLREQTRLGNLKAVVIRPNVPIEENPPVVVSVPRNSQQEWEVSTVRFEGVRIVRNDNPNVGIRH